MSKRNIITFTIGAILLLYIHFTVGPQIAQSLLYAWYFALILGALVGLAGASVAIRKAITNWAVEIAKARKALAEAAQAQVDVRSFPRDHQVYEFGVADHQTTHALHLDPRAYSNGQYQAPTKQDLTIYQQFYQQVNYHRGAMEPEIIDIPELTINLQDNQWIDTMVLPAPHVHLCGPTTSGKTTLGKYIISRMSQAANGTDFYLINPKHIASENPWPFPPFCDSIDKVLSALAKLVKMLQQRIADPGFRQSTYKNIVIIVDEWDWIFEHHRHEAVRLLRQLVKVGAELNYKVILLGQSPLSGDTGLSGSDYHNMVRVAIWGAGEKLISSLSIPQKDKAPYKAKMLELRQANDMSNRYTLRYALVIPLDGEPQIKVIPHIGRLELQPALQLSGSDSRPRLQADLQPSSDEQQVIDLWLEHRNWSKLHQIKNSVATYPGGSDINRYKSILDKWHIDYN